MSNLNIAWSPGLRIDKENKSTQSYAFLNIPTSKSSHLCVCDVSTASFFGLSTQGQWVNNEERMGVLGS